MVGWNPVEGRLTTSMALNDQSVIASILYAKKRDAIVVIFALQIGLPILMILPM